MNVNGAGRMFCSKIFVFLMLSSVSVHASLDTTELKTKVLTYNVCTTWNLYGTDLDPKYRMPKIVQQIKEIGPDVICLQEPRRAEAKYLSKELMDLGYATMSSFATGSEKACGLITAYKENKYFYQENKRWWFNSEDPTRFGSNEWTPFSRIFTVATLCRLTSDKSPDYTHPLLHVCNTHLGLKEKQKTFSLKLALKLLRENYSEGDPRVFCGDFNSFDFNFIDNEKGHNQPELMAQAGYVDLVEGLTDLQGRKTGTLIGYSTDRFAPKLTNLCELSKLDHVFVCNVDGKPAKVPVDLASALECRDEFESDHFPVLVEIAY